jgi:hypothetical protein
MTIDKLQDMYGDEITQMVLGSARHGAVTAMLQHQLGTGWQGKLWDFHQAGIVEVLGRGDRDEHGQPEQVTGLRLTPAGHELLGTAKS